MCRDSQAMAAIAQATAYFASDVAKGPGRTFTTTHQTVPRRPGIHRTDTCATELNRRAAIDALDMNRTCITNALPLHYAAICIRVQPCPQFF